MDDRTTDVPSYNTIHNIFNLNLFATLLLIVLEKPPCGSVKVSWQRVNRLACGSLFQALI